MSVSHEFHPPLSFLPSLQGNSKDDLGGCSPHCDEEEWRWNTDNPWMMLGHSLQGTLTALQDREEEDGNF